MARKVYYSKPLKYFWEHLYGTQKKLTPELTDEQIFILLRHNILTAPQASFESPDSRQVIISGLELWREDSKGELLHIFFLDKHLRNFLMSTSLSDLDGVKRFLYENGRDRKVVHLYSKTQDHHVVYQFALHLPFESAGYAFSLSLEPDGSVELYYSHGENGGRMSDKFYASVTKESDEISMTHSRMFRLAINTIAYMSCFPECVTDGVPKDLFERGENRNSKSYTVQVAEKIRETESMILSKMPHFRRGHFRFLQSDYFVNKKGQLIFVPETMVKGKAKTVSTSPDLENFDGFSATS